jgi:hypothetical protein
MMAREQEQRMTNEGENWQKQKTGKDKPGSRRSDQIL